MKAIFVAVNLDRNSEFEFDVNEGLALATSAGWDIVEIFSMNRHSVDAKYFIGSGKVEELESIVKSTDAKAIIINHNISPTQERNLDKVLKKQIIDRTQLILNIFASRVTTNEGKLQIELAMQSHIATRLVRRWTHLERQRGGVGLRSGSGEKQIELDKRSITNQISVLKKRLAKTAKQRDTQRSARLKNSANTVSIVGYTNAGKSTLFNTLTKADVYAKDRLFATLQTTTRNLFIDSENTIVLSDTVGFIRDLPHKLVAAFRSTLEETVYARLLLQVVDVSDELKYRQIEDVNQVLCEINADKIPQIIVYNKIDLVENLTPRIDYDEDGSPSAVYISAQQNIGLNLLRQAIVEKLEKLPKYVAEQELVYEPWKNT